MKNQNQAHFRASELWEVGMRNWHSRILLTGGCIVLTYCATRLFDVFLDSLNGSAGGLLITAAGIGSFRLWKQRKKLQQMNSSEEDRLLGYILILSGVVLYPFCLFAIWAQALVCIVILVGIACSCCGIGFFGRNFLSTCLIAIGILPNTTLLLQAAYETFMPPNALENLMAWSGSIGLRVIGQSAVAKGTVIIMADGAVQVAYGCNGLYMAVTMAVASFVLGLFLKQSKGAIALMMMVGAVLAFITNVPRIMLMTLASVYWGEHWFRFWHDSWGGQIFVSGLFTIYYYVIMAIVKRQPAKSKA